MIIATAGHVDHGKTSLVRQLTGVETDTLAEEKARGLSINLGYAYLPRPDDSPLGFIDVPGHQRFINTMISGISGIDLGLLVVAADDGVMPQTVEHVDVLDILGIDRLTVAINKSDKVDTERLARVEEEVVDLLAARRWTDTDIFRVSSLDGHGVPALKTHLFEQSYKQQARRIAGGFRLSIDRCFTARGAGLVVTGTASMGEVAVGDTLVLLPSGREVRVRGLRAHDQAVDTASAGQRVALNLSGRIDAADIERGDWLVDPAFASTSTRLDVAFSLLPGAPFALKHLAPIKMHLGARRIAGRIALVDGAQRRLQPGNECLAQLILDSPVSAVLGERFLLRDQAENVILGGGFILDPEGPKYGKSRPNRLTWLRAMQAPAETTSLKQLLADDVLVDLDHFWRIRNLPTATRDTLVPKDARTFESEGRQWAISDSRWIAAKRRLVDTVVQWHTDNPEQPGIRMTELRDGLARELGTALAMAVVVNAIKSGELVLKDGYISRSGFRRTQSAQLRDHWDALNDYLKQCGLQIPLRSELSAGAQIPEDKLREVIKEAIRSGTLLRLNGNRYALPEHVLQLTERVVAANEQGDDLSIVNLKSHFGSGRKLTVELLEYFDSIHFTKRQGDTRVILDADKPRQRLRTATGP